MKPAAGFSLCALRFWFDIIVVRLIVKKTSTEGFSIYLTLVRLLARVDQVVFLEMGQLSEALFAQVTLERPLAAVHTQVNLKSPREL